MKRFSTYPGWTQWFIALCFALLLAGLLLRWIRLVDGYPGWALAIFFVVPAIQFLITPLFTLLGWYRYHSPMVVSFGRSSRLLDLHNGSSFDYLMDMRDVSPGRPWKHAMMRHYLSALLGIIDRVESGVLPTTVVVRGSSYFLSERSAHRLGFTVSDTSWVERINLALNYVDLLWTYSLANGRPTFPDLRNTRTMRTTGADLVKQRGRIEAYLARLHRPSAADGT